MKLIRCTACNDIVALQFERRECHCGRSWGRYLDHEVAEIGGDAIALGIGSRSIKQALRDQPDEGQGRRFNAFVIPKKCNTIIQR